MSLLPIEMYKVDQVRELERLAIEKHKLPEHLLMERAGRAAYDALLTFFPEVKRVAVLCGKGNNAGDGYVLARLAQQNELKVTLYYLDKIASLPAAAKAAAKTCVAIGVTMEAYTAETELDADVIVDAVLGIGVHGEVKGLAADAINAMNESGIEILSIDVPSGLDADTGVPLGPAVYASVTLTLIGLKQGLLTGEARNYCGILMYDDLELPETIYQQVPVSAYRLELEEVQDLLPERERDAHKGDFGHVLVVGGDYGMAGAPCLAALGALRAGAGMVTVATRPEHVGIVISSRPELMCFGVHGATELQPLLARASVVVIGPGLGQDEWGQALWQAVLATKLPLVVDASALRLLAGVPLKRSNWVLTPHPGEASALLGCTTEIVQRDRFLSSHALQQKFGGTVVLKGAGSIVQSDNTVPEVCDAGNPGMATAGVGDVLAGVIGGLVAQNLTLSDAARLGVGIHAHAGDLAAELGERGIIASDLLEHIHLLVNGDNSDLADLLDDAEMGLYGELLSSANDEDT